MAIHKSVEIEKAVTLLGLTQVLASPRDNFGINNEASRQLKDGFFQMLNGLSTVLKGVEETLNEMVGTILTNEQSLLSDHELETIEQLESLFASIRPLMSDNASMPEELRRLIARVVERGEMLKNLERQFRPTTLEVVPVTFERASLQEEVHRHRNTHASGWDNG